MESPWEGADPSGLSDDAGVAELVVSFLEVLPGPDDLAQESATLGMAELAYGLDQVVSSYLEQQGLPLEQYQEIQQNLINALADVIEEHGLNDHQPIGVDAFGNADGADVLGVLDGHLHDLLDVMPGLEHGVSYEHASGLNDYGFSFDS